MSSHLARYEDFGSVLSTTFFLVLLADIHLLARSPEEGLSVVEQAMAMEARIEKWTFDAELHRLSGELMRQSVRNSADVEKMLSFGARGLS